MGLKASSRYTVRCLTCAEVVNRDGEAVAVVAVAAAVALLLTCPERMIKVNVTDNTLRSLQLYRYL